MIDQVYRLLEEIRREHAPDPRLAVFEIDATRHGSTIVFFGACSVPAAVEALHAGIAGLDMHLEIRDEVVRLPTDTADIQPHALVTAATAPMLAGPLISESHLSQTLLGHRVTVLSEHGRWRQCRSMDGYIGWIHRGYLRPVSETEARSWELGGEGELHMSLGAEIVDAEGAVIARLPWGARAIVVDGRVVLPDGRSGAARGELIPFTKLHASFPPTGAAIASTAVSWQGAPYLWGGITPWGCDCSGLVQAVFRTHGIEMPRDSDQQAERGEEVAVDRKFSGLLPGDLLFFAEVRDRISHVAISRGGSRIVHSAVGTGGVSVTDLLADSSYEQELRGLLVTVRRIVSPGS